MIPSLSAHLNVAVRHHEGTLSNVAAVVLLIVFALSLPAAIRREPGNKVTPPQASAPQPGEIEVGAPPASWSISL